VSGLENTQVLGRGCLQLHDVRPNFMKMSQFVQKLLGAGADIDVLMWYRKRKFISNPLPIITNNYNDSNDVVDY
jgi:hypothetical protein